VSGEIERERGWRRAVELWDRHHVKAGWITVGFLFGGFLGAWGGGAAAACGGDGCAWSWQAFEAIGTWFGAVAGVLAVGAAIATYRSGEQDRAEERRRESLSEGEREEEALAAAARVSGQVTMSAGQQVAEGKHRVNRIRATVFNRNTKVGVHQVRVSIDGGINGVATPTIGTSSIAPNGNDSAEFRLGPRAGSGAKHPPAPDLTAEERRVWLDEITSRLVLTYVINDVAWRRRGGDKPIRVEDP